MHLNSTTLCDWAEQLPGALQEEKFDAALCYTVGKKIFLLISPGDTLSICLKVSEPVFDELCEIEGVGQAPYFARRQWIAVKETNGLSAAELKQSVKDSYALVVAKLPKRVRQELAGSQELGK